jgi:hypothetical protein|tara:strand:+ start:227 stop:430 length:204 start_codon:yes stop_codon:yes gene_type:complete
MITDQEKKQFFMWRELKKEISVLTLGQDSLWSALVRMQEVSERNDAQNEAKIARLEAIISELGGDTT